MAIPPQLTYTNEEHFTLEFLIPLLQRLGFSLVVNYHGRAEFGKDLIFAELDRFGHVRYHAMQAKYEPSIGLNQVEDLIRDCKQAFLNPFTHPQTGSVEVISSFYAANGGSVSTEAAQHYFNSLRTAHGANVRLLQAKDLIILDRWATGRRADNLVAGINGLRIEIAYNSSIVPLWLDYLEQSLSGMRVYSPIERLRAAATNSYLMQPTMSEFVDPAQVLYYANLADVNNRILELILHGFLEPENRTQLQKDCIANLGDLRDRGAAIQSSLTHLLDTMMPKGIR